MFVCDASKQIIILMCVKTGWSLVFAIIVLVTRLK